jgi:quinoprotein glucose dehydrogenase
MYINSNEMAWLISLRRDTAQAQNVAMRPGQSLYVANCTTCHGTNLRGNPSSGYPSLVDIAARTKRESVTNIISQGKGRMPAFPKFTEQQKKALVAFLFGDEKAAPVAPKETGLNKK